MQWHVQWGIVVWLLSVGAGLLPASGTPVIREFLAVNQGGMKDEDGETPDWIEIHNPGPGDADLTGWTLTDVATNLAQWRFPTVPLPAGGSLVVFASGKDRRIPGQPLHTSFRLASEGEFLALVSPSGEPVQPVFAPAYPPQFANVSYGTASESTRILLEPTAPVEALVPADGSLGTDWRQPQFPATDWLRGTGGAGYEASPADYAGLIGLDLRAALAGRNTSVFLRFPFQVPEASGWLRLRMKIQYDDGFVAWLNGREVARRNAPNTPVWDSAASADHPDGLAVVPEELDLTSALGNLVSGENVLAVQGLNVSAGSSDLLVRVSLEADRASADTTEAYFEEPSPGSPNRGGVAALGPRILEVQHAPAAPASTDPITITARVSPAGRPVRAVTLVHRVRFGPEIVTAMADDGTHGDGAARDGIFGARIPAGTRAGDMVRYRIEASDADGAGAQLPLHFDPEESARYFGLVVSDPGIRSELPVLHLFVEQVDASESFAGTRAAIGYLGEFYDNVEIRVHGQSSSGFPKKSFNLDFNRDHRFRYATNRPRVKDLKLLTNYGDKSRLNNTLAYEVIAATGSRGHFAFPVRVQRNGAFHGIQDVVEDGDDRWLERMGLSPEGALYKVYDALDSAGGSEKKTRREEGSADLQDLITGLTPSRPLAQRAAFAWDNLDLPQTISYFVGLAVVSSQDHGHKNFYIHRDTIGSGDWSPLPWDVDLTFGRNWTDSGGYFTDTRYTNNVLNFYNPAQQGKPPNRLYSLIFAHPEFRRMYLRRLRTVMDTVLQSPETPAEDRWIEGRIRYWLDRLDPPASASSDADLDFAKWGTWGAARNTRAEAQRVLDLYLPGRRNFLFLSSRATVNGEGIPAAQAAVVDVRLDRLDFNPSSGRQSEEYVRLTNAEPVAVDVSGWTLGGPVQHTLRPGTVLPAGGTLHVSPDVAAFRNRAASPKRGEGAFVQGNYVGQLSARGGTVELRNAAGDVVSTLAYAGEPTPLQRGLRLSELMFHPADPPAGSPYSDDDFEFLEFKNVGRDPLNLLGARFTEGITFAFTNAANAQIAPGARMLLVRNAAALATRHGSGLPVAGEFLGALDNAGESLRLEDAAGETVFEFRYEDDPWPGADGRGHSLEPISPDANLNQTSGWRQTPVTGGTPGRTAWPPPVDHLEFVGTGLRLSIRVEAGVRHFIEGSGRLTLPSWSPVTDVRSGAEQELIEFTLPLGGAQDAQFLRVVAGQ